MKKIIITTIALMVSVLSYGLDFEIDSLKFTTLTESTVSCVASSKKPRYPIVPETVTYEGVTYTVTEIGYNAFYYGTNNMGEYRLKKVVLPKTIKKIGKWAFYLSRDLHGPLIIPAAVEELGEAVFQGCWRLSQIIFEGNKITEIPKQTFSQCQALVDLKLPKSINTIREYAFDGCQSFVTFIVPDDVEVLESMTFHACNKLQNIRLPKNLKHLHNSVFSNCESLKCVIFPEHLETIGTDGVGNNVFNNCEKLREIYFLGQIPSMPTSVKSAQGWLGLRKTYWEKYMSVYVKESLLNTYKAFFSENYIGDEIVKYQIPYSQTTSLSTYYREFDSDFHVAVGESNIKPFVATGYDSQKAYLTSIDNGIVPKECGVVIRNNTGNSFWYQIAEVQGNPQPAVNYLKGFCWEQTLNPTEEDGSVNYVLYNNEFCTFDNSGMLGYHKAYLQLPASAGSKQITMSFADEPSGIGEVEAGEEQKVYYNLSGMRVEKPKKGVYVQNGKKIIFK